MVDIAGWANPAYAVSPLGWQVSRGVQDITLDGQPVRDRQVQLLDDSALHQARVRVRVGGPAPGVHSG